MHVSVGWRGCWILTGREALGCTNKHSASVGEEDIKRILKSRSQVLCVAAPIILLVIAPQTNVGNEVLIRGKK